MLTTRWRPLGVDTGAQTYLVVGDVHGQWKAYKTLLAAMANESSTHRRHLITLGDIIDKGPKSIRCLKATLDDEAMGRARADLHTRLFGNHEIMMLETLRALGTSAWRDRMTIWKLSGADRVLSETDLQGSDLDRCGALVARLGLTRLERFQDWQAGYATDGLRFVHAGYCPTLGWEHTIALHPSDLWQPGARGAVKLSHHWAAIRQPFLTHPGDPNVVVFHGHSIPRAIVERAPVKPAHLIQALSRLHANKRICLDGGAGKNRGVAGAIIQDGHVKLLYSPV